MNEQLLIIAHATIDINPDRIVLVGSAEYC